MPSNLLGMTNLTTKAGPDSQNRKEFGFHQLVDDVRVSALRKYQDLVIGDHKLLTLLKCELLLCTVALVPGAAGILLRQYTYRSLIRQLGKGTVIGRSVTLRHPGKISVGAQTVIDDYCVLNALGDQSSEITIGNKVFVGRNTVLQTRGGRITIHDYADIGQSCRIGTMQQIEIGRYALIAGCCCIGGGDHRVEDLETPIVLQGMSEKGGVVIEDNAWIGINAIIVDGVRIGKGSIVGAGSVVTKDVPAYSIAYGVPAQVRRTRA